MQTQSSAVAAQQGKGDAKTLLASARTALQAGDLATAPGQDVSPVFEGNSQGCLSRGRGAQL